MTRPRGQSNLLAVAVALLVVTTTAGLAFAFADDAFAGATRDTDGARAAGVAERLVADRSPLTARQNVLDRGALDGLDADTLAGAFPALDGTDYRIRLGDRTLAARGDPGSGATVERVVLVQRRAERTVTPPLETNRVTLPRRTPTVGLTLDPPNGTTLTTVRANGRVVLHDPGGLAGTYDVAVGRYATTTLVFDADGPLREGAVTVTYRPAETTKALLEVTVDD